MRRGAFLPMVVLVVALAAVPAAAAPKDSAETKPETRPMIVAFEDLPRNAVRRFVRAGISRAALFPAADAAAVIGPASAYRAIRRWRDVVAFYREHRFAPQVFQTKAQLGVDAVRAGAAPLKTAYTGAGVTVAVVDTGIDTTHPDLDDRVVKNLSFEPSFALDPITDGEYSRSYTQVPTGLDPLSHGTMVAGVLAGTGEALLGPDDMSGMAPGAKLVNLQFNGSNAYRDVAGIYETNLLAAYQWLIDHHDDPEFPGGIRVVNNSIGGQVSPEDEPIAMTRILERAISEGMILVTATGNDGPDVPMTYPGRLPFMITAGGNCKVPYRPPGPRFADLCPGGLYRDSGRGAAVDVVAPAIPVWGPTAKAWGPVFFATEGSPDRPRADSAQDDLLNRTAYTWSLGTSLSTPQVAGIVALMLEAHPALTHAQAERILQDTAADLGPAGFDPGFGFGQVDAFAAVRRAERLRRRR